MSETINQLTRGHRLLLEVMGFGCFMETNEAAAAWRSMTDRQQQDALVAAVWLAMQPVESVKPGGEINSAIKSKTHGRLLDEFQFAITPEFKEEIPRLFAQAAGMEFQEEAASEAASEDSGEDEVGLTVGTELTVGTGDSDGGCEACQ